ncbi:unnamed protein product [Parnassius apollo]|uniref:(apollo) hypothetical protein n=1 Tax=Parnassius apollo TaxID=110799 RepID=A0A8S3XYK2_PARAO|nr:unnamed protein product [Parnassius apollo]
MIKTAVAIAKQEGVLKLWSGLMPMFQQHAIYSGCRLIFYERFRNAFKDDNGKVSLGIASLVIVDADNVDSSETAAEAVVSYEAVIQGVGNKRRV